MKLAYYEGIPVELVSQTDNGSKMIVTHPDGAKIVDKSELEKIQKEKKDGNKR